MEIIRDRLSEFQKFALREIDHFDLLDIGCAGGIDGVWREIGAKLRAHGFDSNSAEVERLKASETLPAVDYTAAMIIGAGGSVPPRRNPWNRMAVFAALENSAAERAKASNLEKTVTNDWGMLPRATSEVFLPDFLSERKIDSIDFIKIDIDGPDFDVLRSLEEVFQSTGVIGVGMEVNWIGSSRTDEHSFHNTDRFLRECGFDLYDFTKRTYSMGAMPEQFSLSFPAQSVSGRPLQGDAVYLRDLSSPEFAEAARNMPVDKIIKLAFHQSMIRQPDSAAETLIVFRDRISGILDVDASLELLMLESSVASQFSSYAEFMAAFRRNAGEFYP